MLSPTTLYNPTQDSAEQCRLTTHKAKQICPTHFHPPSVRSILILCSQLCLCLTRILLASNDRPKSSFSCSCNLQCMIYFHDRIVPDNASITSLVQITNNDAPHYTVFSIPLSLSPANVTKF